jgi:hypothetical protein
VVELGRWLEIRDFRWGGPIGRVARSARNYVICRSTGLVGTRRKEILTIDPPGLVMYLAPLKLPARGLLAIQTH